MDEKQEKDKYEIPIKGSLGLLASGYKGIMVWRMKKLGLQEQGIKIVPPIVLGKVLKMSKLRIETKEVKETSKE